MQFPVPQFIDVEDKLIGPFSLKQFAFIFIGGLIVVGLYRLIGVNFFFIILALPIAAFSLIMAFGKFNGRRFYESIPIFINFISAPKNMVFQKTGDIGDLHIQPITVEAKDQTPVNPEDSEAPQSKLKRISRMLEQKNAEEEEIVRKSQEKYPPQV